jgi:hypothetical protein
LLEVELLHPSRIFCEKETNRLALVRNDSSDRAVDRIADLERATRMILGGSEMLGVC